MKNKKKSSIVVPIFQIVAGLIIVFIIPKIYMNYLHITDTNNISNESNNYIDRNNINNESNNYIARQIINELVLNTEQGDTVDEVFANFRPMNIGKMKKNFVYRGASPINNVYKRASVTDRLISKNNINYIVDLADSNQAIENFCKQEDFNSPYFKELYNNKKVIALNMGSQYKTVTFSEKMIHVLTEMSLNEGPYYIHCKIGRDRTGFVCMIVGALAGATYDELIDDYMKTYDEYYGITIEKSREKYNLIKNTYIDEMLLFMTGLDDINKVKEADLSKLAIDYLIKLGMKSDNIELLINKITNN